MNLNCKTEYARGIKDGIGIALAYLAVSFTFGLTARDFGFTPFVSTIISATNLTSAGQFAGIKILANLGSLFELFLVTIVINSRYLLMSVSLSQQLDESFTTEKRLIAGFFVTDEIFAVASTNKNLTFKYYMGLVALPYLAWSGGTLLGALASSILPTILQNAMGIALYCMFIAIIVPIAKKSKGVLFCVALAIVFSVALEFLPFLSFISSGFKVIIASVLAATISALSFPLKEETEVENV